ncbi:Ankyrin repeat-containing domain protein, partial [Rhypophila decipiens]
DDFEEQKTAENALRCILRQLFDRLPILLSDALVAQFEKGGERYFQSFANLWKTFLALVATNAEKGKETICILDALDECQDEGSLKFLLTSRPDGDIEHRFQGIKKIYPTIHLKGDTGAEVQKISREVELVVDNRLEELARERQLSAKERETLRVAIRSMQNRTYLWVHLIFEYIRASVGITAGSLAAVAHTLPQTVEEAYEKMLVRSPNVDKAKELLQIVLGATRPLTLPEAVIALAVKEEDREWDDLDMEPEHRFRETDCNRTLAQRCIWYLHLRRDRNHTPRDKPIEEEEDRAREAFVEYAVINWTLHYRDSGILSDDVLQSQAQELFPFDGHSFESPPWYRDYYTIMARHQGTAEAEAPESCHHDTITPFLVLVLSYFGLEGLLEKFLQENENCRADGCDHEHRRDAFSWACVRGHEKVVRVLLAHISKSQGFPKRIAKWEERIVVNRPDKYGRRPLHYAAEHGNENMVNMLLENHADKHCVDYWGLTPITWAEYNRRENIVKILCPSGLTQAGEAMMLEGALRAAPRFMDPERLKSGWVDLLPYLLKSPSLNIDAEDAAGVRAIGLGIHCLTSALRVGVPTRGHVATAQFLLHHGCNANSGARGSPLIEMCSSMRFNCETAGFIHDIAKLLIENGADLAVTDYDGRTVLFRALLLSRGANVNAATSEGKTALWEFVEKFGNLPTTGIREYKGSHAIPMLELLIKYGANINAKDTTTNTNLRCHITRLGLSGDPYVEEIQRVIKNRAMELHRAWYEDNFMLNVTPSAEELYVRSNMLTVTPWSQTMAFHSSSW